MIYIKQKVSGQKTSTLVSTFYKSLVLFQYNFHKNKICETLNWHIIKIWKILCQWHHVVHTSGHKESFAVRFELSNVKNIFNDACFVFIYLKKHKKLFLY